MRQERRLKIFENVVPRKILGPKRNKGWWVCFGGLVVSVLVIGPKVSGFKPSRGRWILNGDKTQQNFLRRGSKAVGPMYYFTAL
jgi:hypothetical protein